MIKKKKKKKKSKRKNKNIFLLVNYSIDLLRKMFSKH